MPFPLVICLHQLNSQAPFKESKMAEEKPFSPTLLWR